MKNDLNLKNNQSINHQTSPKRACCDISNDITFLTHVLVVNIGYILRIVLLSLMKSTTCYKIIVRLHLF